MVSSMTEGQVKKTRKVIVIGSSAGGIDALREVLSRLPANLPAAILVVQHLRDKPQTHLPEYLAQHCRMQVRLAEDGLPVEPGVVYVAVPGQHLRVDNERLILSSEGKVNYVRPSVDILFASAAQAYGTNVIGVILSGTGRDGAHGCQIIKANGGTTIAQDEPTSRQFAMPRAAIDAGAIDYIQPVEQIPGQIVTLVHDTGTSEHADIGESPSSPCAKKDSPPLTPRDG